MSNSVRIEILWQRIQVCSDSPVKIDRSFPASLESQILSSDWILFCDYVDRALKPVEHIRKKMRRLRVIAMYMLFSFVLCILGGILFISGTNIFPELVILDIIFGIPVVIYIRTMKASERDMNDVIGNVQRVLRNESEKRSNISFHWREDACREGHKIHYWIECILSTSTIPMGVVTPVQASLVNPSAPIEGTTTISTRDSMVNKTTMERLQELEEDKSMLTEEEYKKKKTEILESL